MIIVQNTSKLFAGDVFEWHIGLCFSFSRTGFFNFLPVQSGGENKTTIFDCFTDG